MIIFKVYGRDEQHSYIDRECVSVHIDKQSERREDFVAFSSSFGV